MLIPVILSGGFGSRLWPLSRKAKPKHFMPLIEDNIDGNTTNGKSLLQQTIYRCSSAASGLNLTSPFTHNPIMVCDAEHRFLVADQCLELNINPDAILLEPERKDTAAAIMLALFYIERKYPGANVLVSPSDHYMSDVEYYLNRVASGLKFAEQGKIVTFGIKPEYPETGYGYIEADLNNNFGDNSFLVKKFIEKPDYDIAEKLIKSDNFYWNSGIFMFNVRNILDICKTLQPKLYEYCSLTANTAKGAGDNSFVFFNDAEFSKINPISIDYALMQDVQDMVVLKYDGQWSDVGCWRGVWKNSPKDNGNNVVMGQVINEDTKNCYLRSDSRLIVTIGVDNLSVIETPDAVLVTSLENSSDLRTIVESSITTDKKEFIEHSHVHRPWGEFILLSSDNGYKVKKLIVKPEASLSLQMHNHRTEHWVVVNGEAKVIIGEEEKHIGVNDLVTIPVQTKHRITNESLTEPLIIVEIQVGDYLEEDDIIRFEDIYGRILHEEDNFGKKDDNKSTI